MSLRWFRGSSRKVADVLKNLRLKPRAPESPKPKHKKPKHVQRAPKVDKPVAERPFIDPSVAPGVSSKVEARGRGRWKGTDQSRTNLILINSQSPIVFIEWNDMGNDHSNETGKEVGRCDDLADETWSSLKRFLDGLNFPPYFSGKGVGMWGYSHPNCECRLDITCQDKSSWVVTWQDHTKVSNFEEAEAITDVTEPETPEVPEQEPPAEGA